MSTKGKWLTIEQKCEVIAQHRRAPATNYTQLALWAKAQFALSVPPTRQTIRNILQRAGAIEAKRLDAHASAKGRSPCVRSQELEDRLQQYVEQCAARGQQLTRRLLHARAREILDAMPNAPTHNLSVGWLTRFMKRHGLRFQKDREGPLAGPAAESVAPLAEALPVPVPVPVPAAVAVPVPPALELPDPSAPLEHADDSELARVDRLRQKATKRLREIEKEARELRKYLRRLDEATNAHLTIVEEINT